MQHRLEERGLDFDSCKDSHSLTQDTSMVALQAAGQVASQGTQLSSSYLDSMSPEEG